MTLRILVTGANKGIGLAIARAILTERDDTFVLLGSRDRMRGNAARDRLVDERSSWSDRLHMVELDVSSDDSVSKAAGTVTDTFGREPAPLYAIVNNAGVGWSHGLATVLDVNTVGIRRICDAFLPLVDPDKGRVVNITSASGPSFVSKCSPERQSFFLDPDVTWSGIQSVIDESLKMDGDKDAFAAAGLGDGDSYGLSKALANAYTVLLARNNPKLRINACTPGFIETDMTRAVADSQGKTPAQMGMKSPDEGARSAMFLLFGEPEGNGRYYGSDAQRSPLDRYRSPGSEPYTGD